MFKINVLVQNWTSNYIVQLYPIQCNAMVFIVKGKHDIVTYFVVLAMVIDVELVIWLQLLISLMENSTNKETG